MKKSSIRRVVAGIFVVALVASVAGTAQAQCVGCPTPVVAFSPVVTQQVVASPVVTQQFVASPVIAQPTVTFEEYRGWYPGKWLDRMRMRRWGFSAPTNTVAVAPMATTQTTFFAPTALAPTTTTAFFAPSTPHITAFAPLGQRHVSRQVVLSPVVVAPPVMTTSIVSACSPVNPCMSCPSCPTSVGQASFVDPSCPSCAPSAGSPIYSTPGYSTPSYPAAPSSSPNVGPETPQPYMTPEEAAPYRSAYPEYNGNGNNNHGGHQNGNGHLDPAPATNESHDTNTYLEPPKLFNPHPEDRTASRGPTVDVWQAVYRQPVPANSVNHPNPQRTQAEIDAEGWEAVPSNR